MNVYMVVANNFHHGSRGFRPLSHVPQHDIGD